MLGVVWGLGLRPGFGLLNRVSCDQLHVPKHCRGGGWGVRGGGGGDPSECTQKLDWQG